MPPRQITFDFMYLLSKKHKLETWEVMQIGAVMELYEKGILDVSPVELGEILRKIAPTKTRAILQSLRVARKKKRLTQTVHRLAEARVVVTTDAEWDRIKRVTTAAYALVSL